MRAPVILLLNQLQDHLTFLGPSAPDSAVSRCCPDHVHLHSQTCSVTAELSLVASAAAEAVYLLLTTPKEPEQFLIQLPGFSPPDGHVDDDEQQQRQRGDSTSYDQRHRRQLQLLHVLKGREQQRERPPPGGQSTIPAAWTWLIGSAASDSAEETIILLAAAL